MSPLHFPPLGRKSRILVACIAALVLLWALFDWDWFRPTLERYLSEHSKREVRADHMAVDIGLSLEPTLTFQGVYVQNAPWADTRQPMTVAGEVSFTFSLKTLFDDRIVVSKLVLKNADVDMERQADGLRNWRLRDPEDRGPPGVMILRLEAHRSRLRTVDHEHDYDMRFVASAAHATDPTPPGGQLPTRIDAQGTFRGQAFTAQTFTSEVLSFQDTQEFFRVRGQLVAGETHLNLEGQVADMLARPLAKLRLRLEGTSLSQLPAFIYGHPVRTRPYRFEGELTKTGDEYMLNRLNGKIGETDITGDAVYDRSAERHTLSADLRSMSANLADIRAVAGMAETPISPSPSPSERLFSGQSFKLAGLRGMDGQLKLNAGKLVAINVPALGSLHMAATLQDGILDVQKFDLGLADGQISAQMNADIRHDAVNATAKATLANVQLERVLHQLSATARHTGPLSGTVSLSGRGDSVLAIMRTASGQLELVMNGGRISNLLDAKLSLNLGKMAALMFRGNRDIPLYCARAAFDFRNGYGKARYLLMETEQTRVEGSGAIYLGDERLDLLFVPRPKHPGLFTVGASIAVRGGFKRPDISVRKGKPDVLETSSEVQCPHKG